jgi:hypothetical protein
MSHTLETTVNITYDYVKTFALNALKQAQKDFNKNPNTVYWDGLTRAMLTHQQAQAAARVLRSQSNIDLMLEKLAAKPLGDWPEIIVKSTTGMTIKDVLTQQA